MHDNVTNFPLLQIAADQGDKLYNIYDFNETTRLFNLANRYNFKDLQDVFQTEQGTLLQPFFAHLAVLSPTIPNLKEPVQSKEIQRMQANLHCPALDLTMDLMRHLNKSMEGLALQIQQHLNKDGLNPKAPAANDPSSTAVAFINLVAAAFIDNELASLLIDLVINQSIVDKLAYQELFSNINHALWQLSVKAISQEEMEARVWSAYKNFDRLEAAARSEAK